MRTTQQMSITLPKDMADLVKTKMRSGEYASESEVIRDGLRALIARDRAVESWLNSQLGENLRTFPLRGTQGDDLRPGLRITNYKKRAVIAFGVDTETVSDPDQVRTVQV
jgi:antitoxin ParD1/3/4